jgi:hypothetical protein
LILIAIPIGFSGLVYRLFASEKFSKKITFLERVTYTFESEGTGIVVMENFLSIRNL